MAGDPKLALPIELFEAAAVDGASLIMTGGGPG